MVGSDFDFKGLLRVVDDLSFDWDVLVLFNFSFLGNVFDLFFWNVLRNVLSKILDGIVVGDGNFSWDFLNSDFFSVLGDLSSFGNSFNSSFILVFDDFFLEGHVFDSAFTLDDLFAGVDDSVDNLRLLSSNNCCVGGIPAGV